MVATADTVAVSRRAPSAAWRVDSHHHHRTTSIHSRRTKYIHRSNRRAPEAPAPGFFFTIVSVNKVIQLHVDRSRSSLSLSLSLSREAGRLTPSKARDIDPLAPAPPLARTQNTNDPPAPPPPPPKRPRCEGRTKSMPWFSRYEAKNLRLHLVPWSLSMACILSRSTGCVV